MHTLYDIPAPAKLNLFLHITGRRADGYHLLQSAFMLLDWQDRLHISRTTSPAITRTDLNPHAPALPDEDLCIRAARALQAATGCTQGAHIAIDKHLPAQAGLGGGSSDAASTLLSLNRLWQLHLPRTALERIGLTLGADVPFFLRGHNAWVQGIGEDITPLQSPHTLPPAEFVVIKPPAGLDTRSIFTSPQLQRNTPHATIASFCANHPSNCYEFGRNDLQPVAEALCPQIREIVLYLATKGLQGRMTGSGSAVFAQLTQPADWSDAPSDWIVRQCHNLATHPLCHWVSD